MSTIKPCTIIIKQGANAGKKCHEVNKRCRHKPQTCKVCGYHTVYGHMFKRHKCTAPKKQISFKHKTQQSLSDSDSSSPIPKTKRKRKSKYPDMDMIQEAIKRNESESIRELRNTIEILTREIAERPQQIITNNINITNNISIIAPNFYEALVQKLGQKTAVDMLAQSAKFNKPMKILNELYFNDVDPHNYPIASHNGRYRYLNEEGEIVEDSHDGLTTMISGKIQNAMAIASSELIKEQVAENTVHRLYDVYDIGEMQSTIANFPIQSLKAEIDRTTENPLHPFFDKGVSVIFLG